MISVGKSGIVAKLDWLRDPGAPPFTRLIELTLRNQVVIQNSIGLHLPIPGPIDCILEIERRIAR